jgi:hypothetical protein
MPTIEIMSPLSETSVPPTFTVDGEDDLPRVERDERRRRIMGYEIVVQHRQTGTIPYQGDSRADFLPDGTWTCELTLTAGHNYDIRAIFYLDDMPTEDSDEVFAVQVSSDPPIVIDPIPGGISMAAAAPTAAPKVFTGKSDAQIAGTISCVLLRYSRRLGRVLPVAKYVNTGRFPANSSRPGDWFVNPPPRLIRPMGMQKMLVLVASIDNADKQTVASCTRVIRKT